MTKNLKHAAGEGWLAGRQAGQSRQLQTDIAKNINNILINNLKIHTQCVGVALQHICPINHAVYWSGLADDLVVCFSLKLEAIAGWLGW